MHWYILVLRKALHGEAYKRVRQVCNNRYCYVVNPARHGLFASLEHSSESYACKLLRRERYSPSDNSASGFVVESVEWGVNGSGGHHRDADIIWAQLVVYGFGEAIDEGFGGVVALNAGNRHPCCH